MCLFIESVCQENITFKLQKLSKTYKGWCFISDVVHNRFLYTSVDP
jgi:hypothetical protein